CKVRYAKLDAYRDTSGDGGLQVGRTTFAGSGRGNSPAAMMRCRNIPARAELGQRRGETPACANRSHAGDEAAKTVPRSLLRARTGGTQADRKKKERAQKEKGIGEDTDREEEQNGKSKGHKETGQREQNQKGKGRKETAQKEPDQKAKGRKEAAQNEPDQKSK